MHICICIYIFVTHASAFSRLNIYIYMYMYLYIHIYIYLHKSTRPTIHTTTVHMFGGFYFGLWLFSTLVWGHSFLDLIMHTHTQHTRLLKLFISTCDFLVCTTNIKALLWSYTCGWDRQELEPWRMGWRLELLCWGVQATCGYLV